MLAYHSDEALKAQFVALLEAHASADQIIQGQYWIGGRGCAVGCSIDSMQAIAGVRLDRSDHALYETYIGVPRVLARLEDGIFEGLPVEAARQWPIQFGQAIRPGADLSDVWPRFAVWLLADSDDGVIRFAKTDTQRAAIQQVADLYRRKIDGMTVAIGEWRSVADAAYAAYADAAAAAAYADAAAYAAAYAAADAAAAAAYADAAAAAAYAAAYATAAAADAGAAAKHQARIRQAATLIAILRSV